MCRYEQVDNVLLMHRVFKTFEMSKDQEGPSTCIHSCIDGINTTQCSRDHTCQLTGGEGSFTDADTRAISTACQIFDYPMEEVSKTYMEFQHNNFGILDELLSCVGAGVFPLVAALNHSCEPNCYLRYTLRSTGPTVQIVALRDISMGEELAHSYTDVTASTTMRREKLRKIYGFNCECERCARADLKERLFNPKASEDSDNDGKKYDKEHDDIAKIVHEKGIGAVDKFGAIQPLVNDPFTLRDELTKMHEKAAVCVDDLVTQIIDNNEVRPLRVM